jgi:hypothetical protein
MKLTLKKITHFPLIIALLLLLGVSGCQNEEFTTIENQHASSHYTTEKGTFSQFKLEPFTQKLKIYNKTQSIKGGNTTQGEQDGFYFIIDTTRVLKMYDNTTESYTIPVKNDQTPIDAFQNLVIARYKKGDPRAFLYTYTPDEQFKTEIAQNPDAHFSGSLFVAELDITKINYQTEACRRVCTNLCDNDGHGGTGAIHPADNNCLNQNHLFQVCYMDCSDNPFGGSTANPNPNIPNANGNTPGDGAGTSGSTSTSNPYAFLGVPTQPVLTIGNMTIDDPEFVSKYDFITKNLKLDKNQLTWVSGKIDRVTTIFDYLFKNNTVDGKAFVIDIINFQMEADWKGDIKKAIANGITSSAELVHKIYSKLSAIAIKHPSSISYINNIIDGFRNVAITVVDTNPNTSNWTDLFNMWLFELGSTNPIKFIGSAYTVNSLINQDGVNQARTKAIQKIQSNDLSDPSISHPWVYGQVAFYDGLVNGNIATSFLGSYVTQIKIETLPNGQHKLTFHVSNSSTWDSATRLRIDNDHNGVHDGIFPNHFRIDDPFGNINPTSVLHMGGDFYQDWYWTEIIN